MNDVNFRLEDIEKNNGKNGNKFWLVIKGRVYDITEFRHSHPGGEGIVAEWAGKDATIPFADVGHSSDADEILKQLKIGEIATGDHKTESSKRSFWSVLTGKK